MNWNDAFSRAMTISFATFAVLIAMQIFISRLYRPRSEDKFIIGLFVLVPAIIYLLAAMSSRFALEDLILSYILTFVLCSSWVATYPAIYASCPTLIIVLIIAGRKAGISATDLSKTFNLDVNSKGRVDDATASGLLRMNGQKMELTLAGRILYWLFKSYKTTLGLRNETM